MKRQRAQNLVEFGLVAPMFFLLVLGLLDLGRATWYYNTTASVARDLARQREFVCALGASPCVPQKWEDLANCKQMFIVTACPVVTSPPASPPTAGNVAIVDTCPKIEVDYGFQPVVLSFFGGATVTLTATSYVPTYTGSGFCP
jgi:TadE-like protein